MTAVLITGTDTRVGKTWVTRGLARALAEAGRSVVAVKPVETGCREGSAGDEDAALLAAATGQAEPREALIRLAAPVVPALAAEREDVAIDLDGMVLRLEELAAGADVLLLEGVGGLLTPITWEWTVVELARAVGAVVLMVAMDRRGVVNHAQLTLSALELAGLPVAGVVVTAPETPDPSTGTAAAAIARLSGLEQVLELPRSADPAAPAEALRSVLGWLDRPETQA
jgi:dethiobiotin synthetase